MIHLGMHTDNWRTLSGSMADAVASAKRHRLDYIEFGVIDGQDFIQGLGYAPTISLDSNPIRLKRYLEEHGLKVWHLRRCLTSLRGANAHTIV
jgi:sugar phosphate isomerase/epimerase